MQIYSQLTSVYISYQIQGRKKTNIQLNRVISQVIILNIVWTIDIYNGLSNINNLELIQAEGMYKITKMTQILEIFILFQVQLIFQQYITSSIKSEQYLILIVNQVGLFNQLESQDFIILITAWEQINQSQYQLVTMGLSKKTQSLSAGLKYFQLSAQTTGFLQLGVSQIYSHTGTTNLDIQYIIQSMMEEIPTSFKQGQLQISVPQTQKQAAAPLHNWAPDLYDAIPTPIVIWIALIPKQGIQIQLQNLAPILLKFKEFYLIIAIISVIVGSVALGAQYKIKRFLAYSAISHIGFLLISYITVSPIAYSNYQIIYIQTSQQVFIIILALNTSIDQQTSPSIKEQAGLYQKNPSLGIAQSIGQFSQAGIPPLAGFFAKLQVLESILAESQTYIAQILILTSAISTANYLSIVKITLQDLPIYPINQSITTIQAYLISGLSSQILFYIMKPSQYLTQLFI